LKRERVGVIKPKDNRSAALAIKRKNAFGR